MGRACAGADTELLRALAQQAALNDDEKRFLADLLQRSELIKFARIEMTPEECTAWAEKVQRFLQARVHPNLASARTSKA